jgi:RHO1 GDP-GTP exchange protein 1/2
MSAGISLSIVSCLDSHLSWLLTLLPAAFRKVLDFDGPVSMVAIPAFNKFIVHCESALFSYPLDLVVRVSQGDATSKDLDSSVEWLSRGDGPISFLKVGRGHDRTVGE